MELNRLCEAVILANKLHEESYVASIFVCLFGDW